MVLPEFAALLELRDKISADQVVQLVDGPEGDWVYADGEIRNTRTDFFRVTGFRDHTGSELVLLRQTEPALVGLVVSRASGKVSVLINARAEPGLIGGTQFSSTVQSTPSNYLRQHGGGATPFIDEILNPPASATVLHDSTQYDWGQHYHAKTKRFRIVELQQQVPAESPLVWVDLDVLWECLRHDHLITTDLRVAINNLRASPALSPDWLNLTPPSVSQLQQVPLTALRGWRFEPRGLVGGEGRCDVVWVRTQSGTREVSEWTQPLMRLADAEDTEMACRRTDGGWVYAIQEGTQPGLDGATLWFPAGGNDVVAPLRSIALSAEGGRFYRHTVNARLVVSESAAGDATWVTLAQLEALAAESSRTSLELRCLLSLAQLHEDVA